MKDYLPEIKDHRQNSKGKTFIVCTKPTKWDNEQYWDVISPYCDYIMSMNYLGDYHKSTKDLEDYAKKYGAKYKLYCALETYISDATPQPKATSVLQLEMGTVKPYCKGIALFRYGLSNYKLNGGVTIIDRCVDAINVLVKQKEFLNMDVQYKAGKSKIYINGSSGDYVTPEHYNNSMKVRWLAYRAQKLKEKIYEPGTKNGRRPDGIYTVGNPKVNPTPVNPTPVKVDDGWRVVPSYKMDYQDTGYTCGPTSMSMGLTELFPGTGSREAELAKYAGTTSSGTPHEGLKKAFLKVCELKGLKGEYWEEDFTTMTLEKLGAKLEDPNVFVICHGNTKGWPSYWKNSYGHYVYPIGVNVKTGQYKIADPTKGVITYSKSEFEAGLKLISQKSFLIFALDK
jgi:hypothetical protein